MISYDWRRISVVEDSGGWRVEVVLLEEAPGSERANNNDLCQSWP